MPAPPGRPANRCPSSRARPACPSQPAGNWRRPAQRVHRRKEPASQPSPPLSLRRCSPASSSFVLAPLRALQLDPGSAPTRPPTKRTGKRDQQHSGLRYAETVLTRPAVSQMPIRCGFGVPGGGCRGGDPTPGNMSGASRGQRARRMLIRNCGSRPEHDPGALPGKRLHAVDQARAVLGVCSIRSE